MKFLAVVLACVFAFSSAIVTRDLPLIKTLAMPENYKDYQKALFLHGRLPLRAEELDPPRHQ